MSRKTWQAFQFSIKQNKQTLTHSYIHLLYKGNPVFWKYNSCSIDFNSFTQNEFILFSNKILFSRSFLLILFLCSSVTLSLFLQWCIIKVKTRHQIFCWFYSIIALSKSKFFFVEEQEEEFTTNTTIFKK